MQLHKSETPAAREDPRHGDNPVALRGWGRPVANRAAHLLRCAALLGATLLVTATPVRAEPVSQPEGWGLGVMLGAPTGLAVKHWNGGPNAFDLGLGVGPGLRLHGDFLWGLAQVMSDKSDLTLDLYLGVGPVLGVARGWCGTAFAPVDRCGRGDFFFGARVPFGIDARLARFPFTFGLELAPGVWLNPKFVSGLLDVLLFGRFVL